MINTYYKEDGVLHFYKVNEPSVKEAIDMVRIEIAESGGVSGDLDAINKIGAILAVVPKE